MDQFGPNRLALLNGSGKISIAQFDPNTQLDYQLPFIRKTFNEKLHGIIYNSSSNTFTVATSQVDSFKFPDDEYSALTDNLEWKPAELTVPSIPKMSLKLLSPTSWSFVDEFAVEPFEHITALEACSLATKETTKGSKSFICVGATAVKGEDRPVRGRVLIFDIMDVVPEPGRPETNVKFKLLLSSDMKLPVSGLADIDGYLAVSLGVKTIIHEFEDNETLNGVAFTDCGVYLTSMLILKKYLVLGDIKRGLNFYGFQEKPPKVLELGRDLDVAPKPVLHSAALLDGQEVLFVAADEDGLLSFFVYSPATSAERLVKRGCYDLHEPVSKMTRVVLETAANVQHATLYMTVKGEIGLLTPLSESQFRTLYSAQNRISQEIPQPAGLHPRASRGLPTAKSVLDLGLLGQTVDVPLLAQKALADEASSSIYSVIKAIYNPFINIFRKFE
jgi:cleavage and polyadenylation specificity factor subunit 1